jgi:hypothetical protein
MMNFEPPCWSEILVDLLTHALDVLTLEELQEIFDDLETSFPELPRGSLFKLLKDFQSVEVRVRIAPEFRERQFIHDWAKKNKIPYYTGCVAGRGEGGKSERD